MTTPDEHEPEGWRELVDAFHERTQRCVASGGGSHAFCATIEVKHRRGNHEDCLPIEDGQSEPTAVAAGPSEWEDDLAHHEAEARRLRALLGHSEPEPEREPSAVEVGGIRYEWNDDEGKIPLSEAIRFHGIMAFMASRTNWTQADIRSAVLDATELAGGLTE